MDDDGTFERLVRELSPDERESLLRKVRNQLSLNRDPLYVDKNFPSVHVEEEYARLPWYFRIVFFILSLFSAKSPFKFW